MEIEIRVGAGTVSLAVALSKPDVAVISAIPCCLATANPEPSIVAIAGLSTLHATASVMSCR
jgi:hypothetical protein